MANVLIVEDEHVLRMTFEQFLIEEGHTVFTASNYNEAEEQLAATAMDVVVSDIILGGKTGITLLRYIAEHGMDVRVIMITGDPSVETASESVRLGAFDYLAKPVTAQDLKRVVRLAVTQKALEEERIHFEASLERYRRDLEAIFNGINAGIVMVNRDLSVRQVNGFAHELLGLEPAEEESGGNTIVLPDDFNEVMSALRIAVEKGHEATGIRVHWKGLPGTSKVLDVSIAPIPDIDRTEHRAVIILRDITRITWLEEQVQEGYRDLIGKSKQMTDIYQLIRDLAETDSTVLIGGESGTGKEMVAEALHGASRRAAMPFIRVNCAALSEDILESELFGHIKGAFTGAVNDRVGRFEAADGGSILLDEIGDISPRLQLRLLRVLQSGEFERVGDSQTKKANVRIIAATNQDLPRKIQLGEFRQDLYYRLNVVRIAMPALRDRREDIPLLVDFFCKRFNTSMNREVLGLSPEALERVMRYNWPGNVRELENCIERSFIVCRDAHIQEKHLPEEVLQPALNVSSSRIESAPHYREIRVDRESIIEQLERTDWNVAKTARALGMARNTLYQKMKTLDLQRPH